MKKDSPSGIHNMEGGKIEGKAKVAGIIIEGGSWVSLCFMLLLFFYSNYSHLIFSEENQKPPKSSINRWKTTGGDAQISFKVKDNIIEDLRIIYHYGNIPHCNIQNLQIESLHNSISEQIIIQENSFSFTTPAKYRVDGQIISNKKIAIEGTFDRTNSSVRGKLDLIQIQTLKSLGKDNSISCIEARKGILWNAEKN